MTFYVSYNCKFIAMRKSLSAAMNVIAKKGLKNDQNNLLYIIDADGETYDPVTGEKKNVD